MTQRWRRRKKAPHKEKSQGWVLAQHSTWRVVVPDHRGPSALWVGRRVQVGNVHFAWKADHQGTHGEEREQAPRGTRGEPPQGYKKKQEKDP